MPRRKCNARKVHRGASGVARNEALIFLAVVRGSDLYARELAKERARRKRARRPAA